MSAAGHSGQLRQVSLVAIGFFEGRRCDRHLLRPCSWMLRARAAVETRCISKAEAPYAIKASALFQRFCGVCGTPFQGREPFGPLHPAATRFDLVINARTAKALSLTVLPSLLVLTMR